MEVLSAVVTKIAESLVAPIGRWLCYSFDYDNNIKTMEDKLQTLQSRRDSVQHSVDPARRNGEEIEACVTRWSTKADETIEEARKIVSVQERAHLRWSNGACMNLKLRHQLSRKAKKIVQVIDEVLENGKFEKVSYRPAPQGEVSRRQMDYVDFGSRKSVAQELMEALGDANTNMIGVWGMPGAGKTTLMREVARQAKEKELFDEVVMVDVTESPNVRRIQGEIADMLGLKLDQETEKGRADRLMQRLTKQEKTEHKKTLVILEVARQAKEKELFDEVAMAEHKKTLVILDDIWKKLDLEKIGIPSTECKVVLTSRDKDLLSCQMGTHKDFRLEELPQNEAWNLFEMTAGDCVKNPNLRCIATEVANECAGLPIVLVTVSKALKNKSLNVWTDALQQLRRPVPGQIIRMQYATIYSSIKLSYSHLESPEVKDFFLRCAEMHGSINCRDLLKYCYGLSLFEDIDNLEQARDRLYALVQHLKDKSLLLDCPYSSEHCRLHDVVRYVARFIASTDHNMFVVSDNSGLKKWTDVESLKRCSSFSIYGGDIHELPNEMECPNLRLLCVYGGHRSLQFPETFFKRMKKLQVLKLVAMKLPSLPSSLGLLRNLQTLCLDQCALGDIAVIGELKNLVILSLLSSGLSQLPKEIGLLTRLRLLDLSHCYSLKVIPPKVLSSLVELEELYMRNCFVQWETEGLNSKRNNASLAELHLSQLITLEIHITNVRNLPKDLLFEKLKRYAIFVGDHVWDSSNKHEASRILKLKLNTSFQSEVGIKMLLRSVEDLYLDELKGVKSLLNELDTESFQQLKHLHIQNNPEIKYITNLRMPDVAFPALETFHLENMISLEEICHDQLSLTISFRNLRIVKVTRCNKLKFIFSSSMASGLEQLQELEVRGCSIMRAIVMKDGSKIEDKDTSLFPKLRRLALEYLPKLMSFLSTQNPLITDAGEIISEGKLHFHMPILHEQVVFPILEMLKLSSVNLVEIEQNQHPERSSCILRNTHAMSRFENLSSLEVHGIGNIKYMSSFSIARFMVQLKHLDIMECEVMEEILVIEELGVKEKITPEVLFPQLEFLRIQNLPILKRFCLGSNIEFPSLKTLSIAFCPKVETFISKPLNSDMTINKELKEISAEETPHSVMQHFFNEEATFPKLERLLLADYHTIWRGQFLEEFFCKLKGLRLLCNHNEADVSPPNFVKRLHNLEELVVRHSYFQEIFPYEELLDQEKHVGILAQLRVLKLSRHPKLTHLWNEDSQPCPIFHNLEILEVSECGKLKMLAPSSVSFQNLSELEILKCHGLISLVTSSTAKSLVQLKKMSVSECKRITEIVRGDGGEGNDQVISFNKLTGLKLDCLPQLSNFCSGGYSFEFPSLEEVIVSQCQEMKIFSGGVLSTPKLKRVQATKEDEGHWKDDLNATIHWLWESKLCIPPSNNCSEKEVQDSEEDEDHP